MGIFVALAMIFSYIEALIPLNFGIPGVKAGLANLIVVAALYRLKPSEAFLISMARILLTGLLFGSGLSLLYSLSGGLFSFAVMYLLKRTGICSVTGVSVAGGVAHNAGQLLAAYAVLRSGSIWYYAPVLTVAGVLAGTLIGFLSDRVLRAADKTCIAEPVPAKTGEK